MAVPRAISSEMIQDENEDGKNRENEYICGWIITYDRERNFYIHCRKKSKSECIRYERTDSFKRLCLK